MDPLSAIGLASAIIQFVDFGSKILVTGYETYHSVHGTTNDNIELESLTRSLYKFQEQLTISPKQLGHSDPELQKLAQESSNIRRSVAAVGKLQGQRAGSDPHMGGSTGELSGRMEER
jgi:hypothetical protein